MFTMQTKAIRLVCHQSMVNYAKPNSYLIKESYPLPPYSTVIGMIHAICGVESGRYLEMDVSIQGRSCGSLSDAYTRYSFGGVKYDSKRHQIMVPSEGKEVGVTRGIGHAEVISDLDLIIHLLPKHEEDFDVILKGLESPVQFPALGRHNDLLNILSFEVVSLSTTNEAALEYDAYIPVKLLDDVIDYGMDKHLDTPASTYRLKKRYHIDPKTNRRVWDEIIRVKHLCAKPNFYYQNVLVDSYGNLVFPA